MIVCHPASLLEAEALLRAGDGAACIGGGTALQLLWRRGTQMPPVAVSTARIAGLHECAVRPDGALRMGSGMTLAAVEDHPAVRQSGPCIVGTVRRMAAPAVRRLATLGGNVASSTGCLLPTLLASGAWVEFFLGGGSRVLALEAWLERDASARGILCGVIVPPCRSTSLMVHRKIGLRAAFTPSVIGVAARIDFDGKGAIARACLAVGGGAVRPRILHEVSASLQGLRLDRLDMGRLRARIEEEVDAPDDAFRSGAYRKSVAARALVAELARGMKPPSASPFTLRDPAPDAISSPVSHEALPHRWHVRPDMADKVSGALVYVTDAAADGMLFCRVLRAGVPHANILSIDTSAAESLPGVVVVVTAKDVPGLNAFGIVVQDQPALCADKVRHIGDPVAAVAAIDDETALAALALIDVRYELLPVVDCPLAALEPGAALVHAAGNLQHEAHFERGDVDAAEARCVHIVEDTYTTSRQIHAFMETEGGLAVPEADGSLTVIAGGQHGARDRLQLSRILALPQERIRVVTSPAGGAFGGKDELTVQPAIALLALKTGRPVRLKLDRDESNASGWKRNPMAIRMRTGCDAEGRLLMQRVDIVADCGAYASLSPAVLGTALESVCGAYEIANVRTRGRLVHTNNGLCGAFRGFGTNQAAFAIESQLGRLAAMVGLDPFEMRRRNLRQPGTPGYFGTEVAPTERLFEVLEAARRASAQDMAARRSDDDLAFGTGVALVLQGVGLGSLIPDDGAGRLRLLPDGRIEAAFGLDEFGQGLVAAVQALVAEAVGCARTDVLAVVGDTGRTPDSGSTSASRGTYVVWKAAQLAGSDLRAQLSRAAEAQLSLPTGSLDVVAGGIGPVGDRESPPLLSLATLAGMLGDRLPTANASFGFPKVEYTRDNIRYVFAFGATVARVAVDRVTGEVRVLGLDHHIAAGPIVDVASYLGQVEGGACQGLGFTLTEDALMQAGQLVTRNFDSYMLPGIADAPAESRVFAIEDLDEGDRCGPRGVGEIGIGAVTPAITAAIANATGWWPTAIPVRPEQVLAALDARVEPEKAAA